MDQTRDSRRQLENAQAINAIQAALLGGQYRPLQSGFPFSSGGSQPPLTPFDAQPNGASPDDDHHDESKRSKRLEKNRESARQCRRRKKEYIQTLEERATELSHRIQELQQKYWYTKEKLTEEQRKVAIELSQFIQGPEKERECAVLLSRFSDICYKQGTAAILYHLDQVREILIPAQQIKFVLWGLDQADEFYHTTSRGLEEGTIWTVLAKEIGWTSEQGEQLKRAREIIHRENKEIASAFAQLDALRTTMSQRMDAIQRAMNEIRNLFTPQQQAKFVVWIEQNSAVMKMLNTIGTNIWSSDLAPDRADHLQSSNPISANTSASLLPPTSATTFNPTTTQGLSAQPLAISQDTSAPLSRAGISQTANPHGANQSTLSHGLEVLGIGASQMQIQLSSPQIASGESSRHTPSLTQPSAPLPNHYNDYPQMQIHQFPQSAPTSQPPSSSSAHVLIQGNSQGPAAPHPPSPLPPQVQGQLDHLPPSHDSLLPYMGNQHSQSSGMYNPVNAEANMQSHLKMHLQQLGSKGNPTHHPPSFSGSNQSPTPRQPQVKPAAGGSVQTLLQQQLHHHLQQQFNQQHQQHYNPSRPLHGAQQTIQHPYPNLGLGPHDFPNISIPAKKPNGSPNRSRGSVSQYKQHQSLPQPNSIPIQVYDPSKYTERMAEALRTSQVARQTDGLRKQPRYDPTEHTSHLMHKHSSNASGGSSQQESMQSSESEDDDDDDDEDDES